jgi:putative membrane protein
MTEIKKTDNTEKKRPTPTDSLANERTFLAWIRTGIAIMAFGFVAVKFSLFVNQIALLADGKIILPDAGYSYKAGIALVVIAVVMSVLAFMRYRQVENQLFEGKYASGIVLTFLLTICIVFVGLLLLIYLL